LPMTTASSAGWRHAGGGSPGAGVRAATEAEVDDVWASWRSRFWHRQRRHVWQRQGHTHGRLWIGKFCDRVGTIGRYMTNINGQAFSFWLGGGISLQLLAAPCFVVSWISDDPQV
jgi:hypothetical protein